MTATPDAARSHDEPTGDSSSDAEPCADFARTTEVAKPWGHEAVFAAGEHGYVGKLIAVRAGEALSLQAHHEKDETLAVVRGRRHTPPPAAAAPPGSSAGWESWRR